MARKVGKTRIAYDLWKQYGTRHVGYRLYHAVARKAGWLKRRFPAKTWDEQPLEAWLRSSLRSDLANPAKYAEYRRRLPVRFFFAGDRLPQTPAEWARDAIAKADAVLAGQLTYFSATPASLGFPFDWFLNPFTGVRLDARRHWCARDDFEADQGDIKFIWEPSRFGWAYDLVRAYAATRDEKYPQAFWTSWESWQKANPPQMGPNWQCGQECALRSMALCFALYGFAESPSTTPERVARLAAALAVHAERIEKNIRFAESQVSNHAVSEAVGVYTIGLLFPEFEKSAFWRRRGREVLEREARGHSYADGSYVQHSMNYQRVMQHDYLWGLRLAELNGESFAPFVTENMARHIDFLYATQVDEQGRVPNYGQNDGALVLPLNGCDYLDYRPLLQAQNFQTRRARLYPEGPWDEDLLWLFGPESLHARLDARPRASSRFDAGGYYTLRTPQSFGMFRCHTYRHHPHQADMLHFDLWWHGLNVLRDSGNYSYNAPEPWKNYFTSTRAHNSVELGGESQMVKARRFTWAYTTTSRLHHAWLDSQAPAEFVQGEHYGYRRLESGATHRRAILRLFDEFWVVVDDIFGRGHETIQLAWQLADQPFTAREDGIDLETEHGVFSLRVLAQPVARITIARGQESPSALGWQSLHYGEKSPAPTLLADLSGPLPRRAITLIALGQELAPTFDAATQMLRWSDREHSAGCEARLAPLKPGGEPVFLRASGRGHNLEFSSAEALRRSSPAPQTAAT